MLKGARFWSGGQDMTTDIKVRTRPGVLEYCIVGAVIAGGVAVIVWITRTPSPVGSQGIAPSLFAMFALTAVAWLLMVITRNAAVLFGAASVTYFRNYDTDQPRDWVERPTRVFNNLMQVPMLFYVAGLLAMELQLVDNALTGLAWAYVAARVTHAFIFLVFNYVPLRFAFYAVSCVILGTMWARIAVAYAM